jgi:hypothetical protein
VNAQQLNSEDRAALYPFEKRSKAQRKNRKKRSHHRRSPQLSRITGTLPTDSTGQRLAELFPPTWDWIYSPAPTTGPSSTNDDRPEWTTIKGYPLTSLEQWTHHQDPSCIIGIRPSSETRWGLIDLDRHSPHHPQQNPQILNKLKQALEDIGIVRILINQSSHSGGLHIYIPIAQAVSSFDLACALKYTLEAAGLQLKSGHCEIFPNPKRYAPQGQFSLYNGIRLPMQPGSGFIPLDDDLNPLPWSLDDWLDTFDRLAQQQDHDRLIAALTDGRHNHRIRKTRNPQSLETWYQAIQAEKESWTGSGQTNEKLKKFACEARVFMGMDSVEAIAQHIQSTAEATPGFQEHSNHTEDIAQRSREVATWAIRYYWPMGTPGQRDTRYHSEQTAEVIPFNYHQAKRQAAQHRIQEAVAQLQQSNSLSPIASGRAKQIIEIAHVSQQTLYRSINKPLWHPDHIPSQTAETQTEQPITQPADETEKTEQTRSPESLKTKDLTQLFKYVGFVILNLWSEAVAALALKSQRAATTAFTQSEFQTGGSLRGESVIRNWAELQASLPEHLQKGIDVARRKLQRQQEQEWQRQERIKARQLQLRLEPEPELAERQDRVDVVRLPVTISRLIVECGELPERSPWPEEIAEFEEWYDLAREFGLVTEFRWRGREYEVLSQGRWYPFAELIGVFSVRRLKDYLQGYLSKGADIPIAQLPLYGDNL